MDPASVKFSIICSDDTKKRAGEVIQANLKEIGINCEIESMDLATYLSATAEGDYTAAIGGYTSERPAFLCGGRVSQLLHQRFQQDSSERS